MDLDADLSAKDTEKGVLGERLRVCREETIPKLNDEILFAESIAVYRGQQGERAIETSVLYSLLW